MYKIKLTLLVIQSVSLTTLSSFVCVVLPVGLCKLKKASIALLGRLLEMLSKSSRECELVAQVSSRVPFCLKLVVDSTDSLTIVVLSLLQCSRMLKVAV